LALLLTAARECHLLQHGEREGLLEKKGNGQATLQPCGDRRGTILLRGPPKGEEERNWHGGEEKDIPKAVTSASCANEGVKACM